MERYLRMSGARTNTADPARFSDLLLSTDADDTRMRLIVSEIRRKNSARSSRTCGKRCPAS